MNDSTLRTVIVCTAIICVTGLASIDLLRGGDGATITGAFAVISALVGYEFGKQAILPSNPSTTTITSTTTPSSD